MKFTNLLPFRRVLRDERGQVLMPWMAVLVTSFLGVSGLTMDIGRAYVAHSQLQNMANAAAMAAAGQVYFSGSNYDVYGIANQYSGSSGDKNAFGISGVTTTVYKGCVPGVPTGATCASGTAYQNAVQVVESASVRNYLMPIFWGSKTTTVTAASTATMLGAAKPWNIAIILDASGSMRNNDANCGNVSQFQCALNGIQTMLSAVSPCKSGYTTCATSNAQLKFALFSFPGVSTSTVGDDVCSSSGSPNYDIFTLPLTNATSYSPISYQIGSNTYTATYRIVDFSSDYYSTTASNHLNTSSNLVKAVTGCMNYIQNVCSGAFCAQGSGNNGGITYYASAIYAAQAALLAQKSANSGTNNAIIFVSDGQANISSSGGPNFPWQANGGLGATLASGSSGYATATGNGTYPDIHDQCQQAIVAAQQAAAAGTRVYSIAYGAESQGCSYTVGSSGSSGSYGTDNSNLTFPSALNASFTDATIDPCLTMENIANSETGNSTTGLSWFYSDYNQTDAGNGVDRNCVDSSHPVSDLKNIFVSIISGLTSPKLLPNSAFKYGVLQSS